MADSEIAIQLLEDVIIPACGIKKAGDIVTASDCGDSWEWMLQRSRHKVVVPADDPADAPEVTTEVDVVAKLKESIGDKKYRIDDIVERTGLTEDVVVSALTEANGFQKNQQGWWKVVKS